MTIPTAPGVLVLVALICGGIGCLCFLAAGITTLTDTVRSIRARRRSAR